MWCCKHNTCQKQVKAIYSVITCNRVVFPWFTTWHFYTGNNELLLYFYTHSCFKWHGYRSLNCIVRSKLVMWGYDTELTANIHLYLIKFIFKMITTILSSNAGEPHCMLINVKKSPAVSMSKTKTILFSEGLD